MNLFLSLFSASILSLASFAQSRGTLKCDGIWQIEATTPVVAGCPLAIVARPGDGPIEIRHLSRATADKCAYEDIISNSGPSNQIVCRLSK